MTEDSFPGMLANVVAGRIANRLDLGGANYTVDAACASSLAAVHAGCQELASGTSDMVLCGGADLHNCINDYLVFAAVHALSPTGQCRTFDASADGIALGEGVACMLLKRLADAERDGDRIYAVIKGVGSASDGKSRSLTAPRLEGQRTALERAYGNARISPADVGLVEAHGTGTVLGDRTELRTLTEMFTEAGAAPGSCALGSVKSQIGHTKCAAGLAGMVKAALALHTGVRPPTLHVTEPNNEWQAGSSPFTFSPVARPWAALPVERVAGVSGFGFGGTNFHVVLQGYDGTAAPRHGIDQWPAELLTFHGADHAQPAARLRGCGSWPGPTTPLAAHGGCVIWPRRHPGGRTGRTSRCRWRSWRAISTTWPTYSTARSPVSTTRLVVCFWLYGWAQRAGQSGRVVPRSGQPATRNARRAVRRLPRARLPAPASPQMGRHTVPASDVRPRRRSPA